MVELSDTLGVGAGGGKGEGRREIKRSRGDKTNTNMYSSKHIAIHEIASYSGVEYMQVG